MSDYILNKFNRYIKDSTSQESILDEYAVAENAAEVYRKKLDEFVKDALSKQKKTRDVEADRTLKKIKS